MTTQSHIYVTQNRKLSTSSMRAEHKSLFPALIPHNGIRAGTSAAKQKAALCYICVLWVCAPQDFSAYIFRRLAQPRHRSLHNLINRIFPNFTCIAAKTLSQNQSCGGAVWNCIVGFLPHTGERRNFYRAEPCYVCWVINSHQLRRQPISNVDLYLWP
jgi:hypothetical protein